MQSSLALLVQETLRRDPHAGDLFVFRGKSGNLIKIIWLDGLGMSLYAKRLEKGRFIWPSPADGVVSISSAQLVSDLVEQVVNFSLMRYQKVALRRILQQLADFPDGSTERRQGLRHLNHRICAE